MTRSFEPFTPEAFKKFTGLNAEDNEAIYLRWVNSQINYASYQLLYEMTSSMKEVLEVLKEHSAHEQLKYPFIK